MNELSGKAVRFFVVWEPVLLTDWGAPSTSTLRRLSDPRAMQFWDKQRLISQSMGEHNRRSVVWDYIAVYPAGVTWRDRSPRPMYEGRPVVQVEARARAAVFQALDAIASPAAFVIQGEWR